MIFSPAEQPPYFNYVQELENQRATTARVLEEGVDFGHEGAFARVLATALVGMQLIAILEHGFTRRPTLRRRRAEKCVDLLLQGGGDSPAAFVEGGLTLFEQTEK